MSCGHILWSHTYISTVSCNKEKTNSFYIPGLVPKREGQVATQHNASGERTWRGSAPPCTVFDRAALGRTPLGDAGRRRGPGGPSPPDAPPPPPPPADTPQPDVRRALLAITTKTGWHRRRLSDWVVHERKDQYAHWCVVTIITVDDFFLRFQVRNLERYHVCESNPFYTTQSP